MCVRDVGCCLSIVFSCEQHCICNVFRYIIKTDTHRFSLARWNFIFIILQHIEYQNECIHDPISTLSSTKRVYDSVNDSNNNIQTMLLFVAHLKYDQVYGKETEMTAKTALNWKAGYDKTEMVFQWKSKQNWVASANQNTYTQWRFFQVNKCIRALTGDRPSCYYITASIYLHGVSNLHDDNILECLLRKLFLCTEFEMYSMVGFFGYICLFSLTVCMLIGRMLPNNEHKTQKSW